MRSSGDGRIADLDEGTEDGEDETALGGNVDKDGNVVVFEIS